MHMLSAALKHNRTSASTFHSEVAVFVSALVLGKIENTAQECEVQFLEFFRGVPDCFFVGFFRASRCSSSGGLIVSL